MDFQRVEYLVTLAKSKDNEALTELYNIFTPYISIICSKVFVPGTTKDDLKQECFISLYKAINKYSGNNTFISYATKSIKNNLYYQLRQTLNHQEIPSDSITLNDPGLSLEDLLQHKYDITRLNKAISKLTPQEKSILNKYYLNDLSLMTIANESNSKYITTVKRKDRAIKKLKEEFKYGADI